MSGLADELGQQALEIAGPQTSLEVGQYVFVAEVGDGVIVVVEPAGEHRHRQRDAVRGVAEIALAQVELRLGEGGLEPLGADAGRREVRAGPLHEGAELLGDAGLCAFELQVDLGLQLAVDERRGEVVAQAGVEHRALERRLVGAGDGVEQDVCRQDALAVGGRADHVREADGGVGGCRRHLDAGQRRCDGRLQGQRVGGAGAAVGRLAEAAVDEGQLAFDVQVAVEDRVGVGQVVVACVRVEELLVGQRGDGARHAARLVAVGGVGEERAADPLKEHLVRVGEGALHLVEDHAVVDQARVPVARVGGRPVLAHELRVPALLLEDARAVVDGGVQDGVEVDVHQVLEVPLVGRGDGVHRLVREGQRVEEGLHAGLEQVDEGLLHGEAVRPAQDRVLQDMEDARVVGGRCLEGDGKGFVDVGGREPERAGARGVVAHHVARARELGEGLDGGHGESRMMRADGECGVGDGEVFRLLLHHTVSGQRFSDKQRIWYG